MKVKVIDFEEAIVKFFGDIIKTLPTSAHKFVAGVMLGSKAKSMEAVLQTFADDEGYIETDKVREAVKAGFSACGEKASFTFDDDRISWLLKPVTVNVTASDIENAILSVEQKYKT